MMGKREIRVTQFGKNTINPGFATFPSKTHIYVDRKNAALAENISTAATKNFKISSWLTSIV